MEQIFKGLFDTEMTQVIGMNDFMLCVMTALLCGAVLAQMVMIRSRYTKSFKMTLALLPAVVCVVIMMVNGNIGATVAVAGVFSLVRFRSVPGNAKEITMLFLAMGSGLIAGMGYLAYSLLFTVLMSMMTVLYQVLDFGGSKHLLKYKTIHITIPEDLDYSEVFDDILNKYTSSWSLIRVKTTNMGSLFRCTYDVVLNDLNQEKEMIDQLRCRNGNLEITVSKQETLVSEL